MAPERLIVLLYGEQVGWLQREHRGASFTYDSDYAADGTVALSARLPLTPRPFAPQRVAPYLEGLLPENRETRRLWADQLGIDPDDVFGMLAAMGWDCAGAVQFCRPEDLDQLVRRGGAYERLTSAGIGARLRLLQTEPAGWTMRGEHWSLGGQQEKFALAHLEAEWFEAHGSAATTHILKPGISRLREQALVEHATMAAAGAMGIDVAHTEYESFGDQSAIVVTRFDRTVHGRAVERLHQEDFCQALGRPPDRKYESRGGPTLRDMVGLLDRQSTQLEADRLALADFVAINVVAGAPDGHAKNISLLRASGFTAVAPLYDLATALVYDSTVVDRTVAVSIGGDRRVDRIRSRQWRSAARTLGVDEELLIHRVRQMCEQFPGAFRSELDKFSGIPAADDLIKRGTKALDEHCGRIKKQLSQ